MCNVLRFWLHYANVTLDPSQLQLEILALRHQATVPRRPGKARAPLIKFYRAFWVWLYRLWPGCVNALVIVKPETVVHWRREGFRRYWR